MGPAFPQKVPARDNTPKAAATRMHGRATGVHFPYTTVHLCEDYHTNCNEYDIKSEQNMTRPFFLS